MQLPGQLHPGAFLDRARRTASTRQNEFSKAWLGDAFPRMIAVTFQHPTPYFDDSYAVNSVNVGPYGDAIMNELIPEVEKRFRVIREPYARILSGGSTGGWEAAALQIFHPDFFGAAFAYCPDSVTFSDLEGINIYEDENAFYKMDGWRKVPTANSRRVNGQLVMTSRAAQPLRARQRHEGPIGRAARHLVGRLRADRQGRLLRAALQQADRRDRPRGREVLEGALRPASTTWRRTGRRSGRSSWTSCTSTPGTSTPTT